MQIDILRRIAERGLKHAQREEDSIYCDLFQHMLDEIHQIELHGNSETIRAFRKFADKVHESRFKRCKPSHAISVIATEIAEELEVERML